MISLIVAHASNMAIGADNNLLWHISEDMKYFKRITAGHTVVMGRRTFESIGRPLPKRHNIVVSGTLDGSMEGVEVIRDLTPLLEAFSRSEEEVFILGGGKVYAQTLPFCSRLYITEVDKAIEGADTFFPEYASLVEGWHREEDPWMTDPETGYRFRFVRYEKR